MKSSSKMRSRMLLGFACCGAFVLSLLVVPEAPASFTWTSEMVWVATANWLNCDQTSQANECANWQTPDGRSVYMTCCVPASALGTSDRDACADGGSTRGGRGDL